MLNWIHKLLHPHCEICRDEQEMEKVCNSCEVLKTQLEAVNAENRRLLSAILKDDKKSETEQVFVPQIIHGRHTSFAVKRQMLEAEDRAKADILAKKAKEVAGEIPKDTSVKTTLSINQSSVEALEKELGVSNG